MDRLRYLADVVTLALDVDKCVGCGMCVDVCPHGVFVLEGGKAVMVDRDACMECGACAKNCAVEAISVESGVGCATAVINSVLRKSSGGDCSCGPKCCGE